MQDNQSLSETRESVNPRKDPGGSPLVTTHISEQNGQPSFNLYKFELYSCSLKILRPGGHVISKRGKRREISSFSWASKRRLRFIAANAQPGLISHFGMTYHHRIPSGREVKKNLHTFLISLKRAYPGIGYLWILEFQKRGTVHFHLWLTLPVGYGLHQFMAGRWNDIVEPESEEHLKFHIHEKNLIPWEMRSAGYLSKYLDKEHQKRVPEGFEKVGRFWGCSRGLVPAGVIVIDQVIDDRFSYVSWKPSKMILRTVCKSQERKVKKKTKWTTWGRRSKGNYTILEGRSIYEGLIDYHEKQSPF
ncbi:MAG: hypothetical protein MUP69_05710 [Candidatus Atribacteria bacterium]|nr:hypothetical protein [Candidatus Atribacteria bacterium]